MKTKEQILEDFSSIKVTQIKNAQSYYLGEHRTFKVTEDTISVLVSEALRAMEEYAKQEIKELAKLYYGDLKSHVAESPARESRLIQIEKLLGEDLYDNQ